MKKVFLILVALIGFGFSAFAQYDLSLISSVDVIMENATVDNVQDNLIMGNIEISENAVGNNNFDIEHYAVSEFEMFANNMQIMNINTNSTSNCWAIWSTTNADGYCVAGSEIRYDNYCGESIQGALIYKYYDGEEWSSKQCTIRTLSSNRGNATLMGNSFTRQGKCFVNFYPDQTCRDVGY